MSAFATIDDITNLWRPMSTNEQARAEALLEAVSASLRVEADKIGKDLDKMVTANDKYAVVVKAVTVDIVARVLMTSTNQEPTTQFAQSAGGYSVSGTYLVPGGGIFIKKAELARLGLCRQRVGVIDFYAD